MSESAYLSTSTPLARHRQRSVSAEAISPGLDSLVVNHAASVNIGQGLAGQATTFFFLVYPRGQSLLDDPIFERSRRSAIKSTFLASCSGTWAVTDRVFAVVAMLGYS